MVAMKIRFENVAGLGNDFVVKGFRIGNRPIGKVINADSN
jgi:hypothetical protein